MPSQWQETIPESLHQRVQEALTAAFGAAQISSVDPVYGGASGASTYRVGVRDRFYLLRMEGRRGPLRNPHQYACMRTASEAGLAPPLLYADDAAGAAIMEFIAGHPLAAYPGGAAGL